MKIGESIQRNNQLVIGLKRLLIGRRAGYRMRMFS